ncbi:cytochrome b5 [Schizosaccharomyces japonicus yFS275]|uniref:Cytochrome b5 n=1 Tax=Schizosaccharomyces japonicus (strain yFS275 / FY16936) TaxID=402676 RepID=B6K689_SCHJY|nr:cytochrome b5 [Schizosaccharomyces japonicus yFS275]EEB09043.1 cytochrome b5 [Schizosaccharomyces japonicus yFS275]
MTKEITVEEVMKHNTKDDLYMVIRDNVYDVTKFIDSHPGGEEVLIDVAGRDATGSFEDVGHSEDAQDILKGLFVGKLKRVEGGPELPKGSANLGGEHHSSEQHVNPFMWVIVGAMVVAYIAFRMYFLK